MRKIKIITLIVSILAILLGVSVGYKTQKSYTNPLAENRNFDEYAVAYRDFNESVPILEIIESAHVIVKVRATGNREQKYNGALSLAEVEQVYVGDASLAGQTIGIYEENFFGYEDGRYLYVNRSIFNHMKKDREYYAILYKKEYTQLYQSKIGRLEFRKVPDMYSVIPAEMNEIQWCEPKENLMYRDVKGFDYICSSKSEALIVKENVNSVLEYIKGIQSGRKAS